MPSGRRAEDLALLPDQIDEAILDLRVTGTRVDELRFLMAPPLRLAGRTITARQYVVLQVTLETGATGTAYVLTRGQCIGAAMEAVAQQIVGHPLSSLFSRDRNAHGRSADDRARALLDICAWDLVGLLQEVPTWRLLGDAAPYQQALLVAGYRRHGETDHDMARRVVGWRDAGYRSIKIAADLEGNATTSLLAEIRDLLPRSELDLVLDLGFAGRDVEQIVEASRAWEPYGISWVEDPLPVNAATEIAAIRAATSVPVAVGDEASASDLSELIRHRAVDVLRADTTTVGGLTGLREIVGCVDLPVSFHVYPEIHRHAALVMATHSPIETFPPGDDFDFADRFILAEELTAIDGRFAPPASPGLGLRYRPESVPNNIVHSELFAAGQ